MKRKPVHATRYTRREMMEYMCKGFAGSLALPSMMSSAFAQVAPSNRRKIVFVYARGGATNRFIDMRPAWFAGQAGPDYGYKYGYALWDNATQTYHGNGQTPDNGSWSLNFNDSRMQQSDWSEVLATLSPHRDSLTMLEGLSWASSAPSVIANIGDAHAHGALGQMSGLPAAATLEGVRVKASGPSMDQRIHDFLKQSDPRHSVLSYRMNNANLFHENLYYNADRTGGVDIQPVPAEIDPQKAFDRVFAGLGGGASMNADQAKVFQLLNGNYSSLANRLSSADKARVETHRALLADLSNTMGGVATCGALARPTIGAGNSGTPSIPADKSQAQADLQPLLFEAFSTMVASAFSCGISRVASIGITDIYTSIYGLAPGTDIHHEYEHPSGISDYYKYLYYVNANPNNQAAQDNFSSFLSKERKMVDRNVWQVQQLKKLADLFANTPDPSGQGSLLDNSLIVYTTDISDGNHALEKCPIILLGKFDGAITPGRYVKYAQNIPNAVGRNYYMEFVGPSQTQLFISILQAFGMNIDLLDAPVLPNPLPAALDGYSHATGVVKNAMKMNGPLAGFKV